MNSKLQCGGFLADKWIGEPEPDPYSGSLNPSQRKVHLYSYTFARTAYSLSGSHPRLFNGRSFLTTTTAPQYLDMIVKAWGCWALFQELLVVLHGIGARHGGASVSNIATRWVLDHPVVGAVIIGAESLLVHSLLLHTHLPPPAFIPPVLRACLIFSSYILCSPPSSSTIRLPPYLLFVSKYT